MAYQTGVPASITDIFTQLKTFAVANGFTLSGTTYTFGGAYAAFAFVKSGLFYTFMYHPTTGDVQLNTATGWTAASNLPLTSQAGAASRNAQSSLIGTSPIHYHFFADAYCIHVAIEKQAGVFSHFSFGDIQKHGTFTGGQFASGTSWTIQTYGSDWTQQYHSRPFDGFYSVSAPFYNHIRVTYSSFSYAYFTHNTAANCASGDEYLLPILGNAPNLFNSRSPIFPFNIMLSDQNNQSRQLGFVANAGLVNMQFFQPGDTIETNWLVFPVCAKNAGITNSDISLGYINTLNMGIAYKK